MSDINQWLVLISKFPWVIVVIILIIALTSLRVINVFKNHKSITSAECGNSLFKIKLKRDDKEDKKND